MSSMARRLTITDVAQAAGVSVATVSKVINGRDGIATAASARVLGVVQELGYESSLAAKSAVPPNARDRDPGRRVRAIQRRDPQRCRFGARGHRLRAARLRRARQSRRAGWERRYLSRPSGTLIEGAVIVTPMVVDAYAGVPVVEIDPHAVSAELPSVE
jgi:LacI family transcriptional regulator